MNVCISFILFTHRKTNGVALEEDLLGFPRSCTNQIDQEMK